MNIPLHGEHSVTELGCPAAAFLPGSQRGYTRGCRLRGFVGLILMIAVGGFALFLVGVTVLGWFGIGG